MAMQGNEPAAMAPDDNWPDVSTQSLIATCDEWLAPYLPDINTASALKRLNLQEALQYHLDYTQQQQLSLLAPTHLEVPSGSHIRLEYKTDGSQPVLSVRLQEVFGLADTPCVDNGKQAVLMQLLSPGFKPVQLTSDLRSFWNNAYFEVKRIAHRYPKHVWPDDPWNEPAIRGTKRKKQTEPPNYSGISFATSHIKISAAATIDMLPQ